MRKIKFRGKRLKDEEWITGDLITETDSDMKVERSFIHLRLSPISFTDDGLSSTICLHEVDHETVGEYTVLKDRNCKEVYEGDIIRCTKGCPHAVEFIKEYAGMFGGGMPAFYLSGLREGYAWTGEEEVIGNVFESPELLTKEV